MTVTVRFAPSPTGYLHVGNARVAVINWLFAKAQGGKFILRFDDTDLERSKQEYVDGIYQDLAWLGTTWDQEEYQSKRLDSYAAAAEKLKAMGRLYACYETPDELDFRRKLQLSRGQPPVYDRAALKYTPEQIAAFEAEGRKPHWRFKMDAGLVEWDDLIRGPSKVDASSLSDPVLIRADGTYLYTLPSVVDDLDMGVTHIIRGEDHVTNSAPQIQLFQTLGGKAPGFGHLPLMTDISGAGLSKRLGSMSLRDLRDEGTESMALASLLAKMGSSVAIEVRDSWDKLVADFDPTVFGRSTPKFDTNELKHLNAKLLQITPYAKVADRLPEVSEAIWDAVRSNIAVVDDAKLWAQVINGPITPVIEDAEFAAKAAQLLPEGEFDLNTWGQWTNAVKEATGAKGKALFHPLRLALTAKENGPELKVMLPLIGRDKALARLAGKEA